MVLLSLLLVFHVVFTSTQELILSGIYKPFGDDVKVQGVKIIGPESLKVEKVELDMEYGKSRAVAYLYWGEERYQAMINALWKANVFVALEDIPQGTPIKSEYLEWRLYHEKGVFRRGCSSKRWLCAFGQKPF